MLEGNRRRRTIEKVIETEVADVMEWLESDWRQDDGHLQTLLLYVKLIMTTFSKIHMNTEVIPRKFPSIT